MSLSVTWIALIHSSSIERFGHDRYLPPFASQVFCGDFPVVRFQCVHCLFGQEQVVRRDEWIELLEIFLIRKEHDQWNDGCDSSCCQHWQKRDVDEWDMVGFAVLHGGLWSAEGTVRFSTASRFANPPPPHLEHLHGEDKQEEDPASVGLRRSSVSFPFRSNVRFLRLVSRVPHIMHAAAMDLGLRSEGLLLVRSASRRFLCTGMVPGGIGSRVAHFHSTQHTTSLQSSGVRPAGWTVRAPVDRERQERPSIHTGMGRAGPRLAGDV